MYSNTTHLTQPLDKGVLGPLKAFWHQECSKYMSKYPGKVVTEYEFMRVFSQGWYQAMSMRNIMAGFRTTGVYPFNRDAIQIVDSAPHTSAFVSLPESTELAFIPLYSPVHRTLSGCCSKSQDLKLDIANIDFTKKEHTRFERRFEEGYDLMDDRYKLWLERFHSDS